MDTELFEKELSILNRRMYIALSSAATLLIATFVPFLWIVWFVLLIFVLSSGFNLLWGKNWRSLPLSKERVNTIFGYLIAGWLLLFVPCILNRELCFLTFPFAYAIFLGTIYWRTHQKLSEAEEMFP